MNNLRDKEGALLASLLGTSSGDAEDFDQWKVLICDQDCLDVISPLMHSSLLRSNGVTLFLMLHSDREMVPDAPAVYFVRPTELNLKRIAEDCIKGLYRNVYIHFITRIDRISLEKFALELANANAYHVVSKIYDQYLDVIALEQSLFSLNIKNSFMAYNGPNLEKPEIDAFINKVSTGLLSLIRITGALPIIRAQAGGAAGMLAQNLCDLLRENISPRGPAQQLFSECLISDRARPLLLIFDRTSDMTTPLMHSSLYQPLIDDLLDHKLNKVTLLDRDTKKKRYDLNTHNDNFYCRFSSTIFPSVVEANEKELAEVRAKEAEIRSKPASLVSSAFNESFSGKDGKDLSEAIEQLPEIIKRKDNLETHTNILQALMNEIGTREIHNFFEFEESIINSGKILDKNALLAFLKEKGAFEDKARLLAIIAIWCDTSIMEYESAFTQGCQSILPTPPTIEMINKKINTCTFIRRTQSLEQSRVSAPLTNNVQANVMSFTASVAATISRAASMIQSKFSPKYITRVVDSLAEGRSCVEDDSFITLDPKLRPGENSVEKGGRYCDVIVFVIGGGCYSEYYNLMELLKYKSSTDKLKSIVYGSTEIINGSTFFTQLEN